MKINLKSLLTAMGIMGLLSGLSANAQQNYTITVTPEDIRRDAINSPDPIIPNNPADFHDRGVVRALYAIPAYDERYIKREQINVMKYGIPADPSKIEVIKKDNSVKKYALPDLDKPKVKKSKRYNDAPVAKYALPEFMNNNNPVRNINGDEGVLLKYAMPHLPDEKPVKPENNEINTNDPNGEHFIPVLKYAVPYFPDEKEQNNEK